MNENRLNPRFNCQGRATILFADARQDVDIVDVSYGGMGIQVKDKHWEPFDLAMEVKGEIEINGATTCFNARVCWTSSDQGSTKAGFEVKGVPQDAWRSWVDQLKGIKPPEDPMFDVG